jgi:class 3 adenylate cyclase/tetratricopeptide (TPR) repeat protein
MATFPPFPRLSRDPNDSSGSGSCSDHGSSPNGAHSPDDLTNVGELRLVTVVFCDIVGSTELASRLGAEPLSEVIVAYHTISSRTIERFGGFVAQHLGDGLLAYFGYPHAHEDDPRRALLASLSLFREIEILNDRLEEDGLPRLRIRLAAHTGHAFITEIGTRDHRETLAIGEAINITARLEAEIPGDTLVASSETLELTPDQFVYEPMGLFTPRGSANPIQLNRIIRQVEPAQREAASSTQRSHSDAGSQARRIPGRDREIRLLLESWRRAVDGHGSVVLIEGEAGIGKSHLLRALRSKLDDEHHSWLAANCSDDLANSALQPLIDLMHGTLGFRSGDTPIEKREKLASALSATGSSIPESLPLFCALLSLPRPDADSTAHLSSTRRRHKTLESVRDWLCWNCESRPVVLCVEDVDFADPSLLDLLDMLAVAAPTRRILVLMTCRSRPDRWKVRRDFARLHLRPLTHGDIGQVLAGIWRGKKCCNDVVRRITDCSNGVPLFVVELARAWIDSGDVEEHGGVFEFGSSPLRPGIPRTLEGLMMSRLDSLGPRRDFAQVCAMLANRFSLGLIRAVSERTDCDEELDALIEAGILLRRGNQEHPEYEFRHTLIREVARQSVSRGRARRIHARAARAIDEGFPELRDSHPQALAEHYAMAGQKFQAIELFSKGAQLHTQRSEFSEATALIRKALELVHSLDETSERMRHEVALLIDLGIARQALRGFADGEAKRAFARAQVICEQEMDLDHLFPVLSGLAAANLLSGRLQVARNLALRLHKYARNAGDPGYMAWARYSLGLTNLYLGNFRGALQELEAGMALSDSLEKRGLRRYYTGDPAVDCRAQGAIALWFLGRSQQATALSNDAIARARGSGNVVNLASAEAFRGILHQLGGDAGAAEEHAERAVDLSIAKSFPLWRGLGELVLAWCAARSGKPSSAIARVQSASSTIASTGTKLGATYCIAIEAEIRISLGQIEYALTLLDEAEHVSIETSERYMAAELLRLRAECHLRRDGAQQESAVDRMRDSLEMARSQGAAGLEHRVLVDLARCQQTTTTPLTRNL